MNHSAWNMYVFRDGRKAVSGEALVHAAVSALDSARLYDEGRVLTALIAAGELECALEDAGSDDRHKAAAITDGVAEWFVAREVRGAEETLRLARGIAATGEMTISVHEGFAYYALHPAKFVRTLEQVWPGLVVHPELPHVCFADVGHQTPQNLPPDITPMATSEASGVAVVGLRSIGAPLSAIVRAALAASGLKTSRVTVRPTGHPYERVLELTPELRKFIDTNRDATFIIVDEGPGISGSSFLSTADALVASGISRERIALLGSRQPDVSQLRAPRAAERWAQYSFYCVEDEAIKPHGAEIAISGGTWRRYFLRSFEDQPATWPRLERAKFLNEERSRIFKFEGFGHYGNECGERARILECAGFGAPYKGNEEGFGEYRLVSGRLLRESDMDAALLRRIAAYCALRTREIPGDSPQRSDLKEMLTWNWKCEFGQELPERDTEFALERLSVTDARMMPHEWIDTGKSMLKLDAVVHGDDHFFPGPCDIAWDLAGAIIEWAMAADAKDFFVGEYERLSGDRVRGRLRPYLLGYATFRMAWSKMAAQASMGEFDYELLWRDYLQYRSCAISLGGGECEAAA